MNPFIYSALPARVVFGHGVTLPFRRIWFTFGATGLRIQLQAPDFGAFSPAVAAATKWLRFPRPTPPSVELLAPKVSQSRSNGNVTTGTSKLYDRTGDEITLDEVERISTPPM